MEEIESLKAEVRDLQYRLKAADQEKAHAGQLGLNLLKEKEQLEIAHEALLIEHETNKTEFERVEKLLIRLQNQRQTASDGAVSEDGSALESASLERQFQSRIDALEQESRIASEKLSMYKSDAAKLQLEQTQTQERLNLFETEKKLMRDELKELRQREQMLINDNNELEEENITLQKQVSVLKSAQVEFESMKMEIRRLLEEVIVLQATADEANKLRALAERQEEDALSTAQHEREQRIAIKKELDRLRNMEHLANLNNFLKDIKDGSDNDSVKQLESSFIASDGVFSSSPENLSFSSRPTIRGSDLFSEIHGDLQSQVEELQAENDQLNSSTKTIAQLINSMLSRLEVHLNFDGANTNKKLIDYSIQGIAILEKQLFSSSNEPKISAQKHEKLATQLQTALRGALLLIVKKHSQLEAHHERLQSLFQQLHQFYSDIFPQPKIKFEKVQDKQIAFDLITKRFNELVFVSAAADETSLPFVEEGKTQSPRTSNLTAKPLLFKQIIDELFEELNASNCSELFDEIIPVGLNQILPVTGNTEAEDLLKLRSATDLISELVRLLHHTVEGSITERAADQNEDQTELYQTISKLKSRLAAKSEQASSYRTLLRTNKASSEIALSCLREKYEAETRVKDEALEQLRRNLAHYKEDAASFASYRAMFTARVEEMQGQLESVQESLRAAEDEKKTLNDLIQLAIKKKLTLNQRVEELEMERERMRLSHQHHSGGGGGGAKRPAGTGGPSRGAQSSAGPPRTVRYPAMSQNGRGK